MHSPHRTVLFINRVYPPSRGATGVMLSELASELVRAGWAVTVLTGPSAGLETSTHPEGGVRIVRVRGLDYGRHRLAYRLLGLLFLYPALLIRALSLGRFDVVVTKTDPPFLPVVGALLRLLTRAQIVHWAQDLYPEVAEALGVIRPEGRFARVLRGASSAALRRHHRIVAVGRCMHDRMRERGLAGGTVAVIPNWPVGTLHPVSHTENDFRRRHGLADNFVVMYSGNMGRAHAFEPLLEAAVELREHCPAIRFVFVGDGPREDWIRDQIKANDLHNVLFLAAEPAEKLSQSLSAGDLHLITMRDDACGLVVPSKLYGAMAVGRPCLFLGPARSEAALFIEEHHCGDVLEGATGTKLAHQIMGWYLDPQRCEQAGSNAQLGVREARSSAVDAFDRLLSELYDGAAPKVPRRSSKEPVPA